VVLKKKLNICTVLTDDKKRSHFEPQTDDKIEKRSLIQSNNSNQKLRGTINLINQSL
jgi:hypothetical protein